MRRRVMDSDYKIKLLGRIMQLNEKHEMFDISPYYGYSGRGMYGRTCFGIITSNPANLMSHVLQVMQEFVAYEDIPEITKEYDDSEFEQLSAAVEAICDIFENARYDSLGLQAIVYFPEFDLPELEEPESEEPESEEDAE